MRPESTAVLTSTALPDTVNWNVPARLLTEHPSMDRSRMPFPAPPGSVYRKVTWPPSALIVPAKCWKFPESSCKVHVTEQSV